MAEGKGQVEEREEKVRGGKIEEEEKGDGDGEIGGAVGAWEGTGKKRTRGEENCMHRAMACSNRRTTRN